MKLYRYSDFEVRSISSWLQRSSRSNSSTFILEGIFKLTFIHVYIFLESPRLCVVHLKYPY